MNKHSEKELKPKSTPSGETKKLDYGGLYKKLMEIKFGGPPNESLDEYEERVDRETAKLFGRKYPA